MVSSKLENFLPRARLWVVATAGTIIWDRLAFLDESEIVSSHDRAHSGIFLARRLFHKRSREGLLLC
jgi:hypothetical protein